MLAPDSRALLLDALRPPTGYRLDRAVATTFTLDLASTLMVPLAFAGFRLRDQLDPLELMQALRTTADRFDVFCQAGAIRAGTWPSDLVALLEDAVHEVRRPGPGHIFHPKTWVLRFVDESLEPLYRLLVLSRNLTTDRSWDTVLWLDGHRGRRDAANTPLARFIESLASQSIGALPTERIAGIEQLAQDIRRVEWELPSGIRELRFHPSGIPGAPRLDLEKLLSGYHRMVISPFVRAGALGRLLAGQGDDRPILVSRGEELDALPTGALDGIDAYELDPMASLTSDDGDTPQSASVLSALHAKVFIVERARLAHLFVGSANATDAGLGGNVEFLCELVGSPTVVGASALVSEGAPFAKMLKRYDPPEAPVTETEESTALRALDELLIDLAQVGFCVQVMEAPTGWTSHASSDNALPAGTPDTRITIAPHKFPNESVEVGAGSHIDVTWPERDAGDLSPFLLLTVSRVAAGQRVERSTVICARLVGAPSSRLDDIFVRQVDTAEKFMRLLALLLGLGAANGGSEVDETGGALGGWAAFEGSGILELLARALVERPEAIDHLRVIVDRLRTTDAGQSVLPPNWDSVWLAVLEARESLRADS